jgi:hypothetical protein
VLLVNVIGHSRAEPTCMVSIDCIATPSCWLIPAIDFATWRNDTAETLSYQLQAMASEHPRSVTLCRTPRWALIDLSFEATPSIREDSLQHHTVQLPSVGEQNWLSGHSV